MLRFAPSPTGYLHAGNLRVAIINFLFAKKNGLDFFIRIDDTDKERSKKVFADSILIDLKWIGLNFKKVIYQSDREEKYKEVFNFLKQEKLIYPCFESSKDLALKRKILLKAGKPPIYDKSALALSQDEIDKLILTGKSPHWRLKLDQNPISWKDLVHGKITFKELSISDPVVFRSDEMPLFTITSVVDDSDFNVSHIFRGDDHITNTAAQIKLFSYLGSKIPQFGHLPLMKEKSGAGLSKRDNSFSIKKFINDNIFPKVIINYLCKIGSNQNLEKVETLEAILNSFDLSNLSKNSVIFDYQKLIRINSKYLRTISLNDLKKIVKNKINEKFWNIIKENIDSVDDVDDWYDIIYEKHKIIEKIKIGKDLRSDLEKYLPENLDLDSWDLWVKSLLEKNSIRPKELFINLRLILTGKKYGPSMTHLLTLFDRKEIIWRINNNCE